MYCQVLQLTFRVVCLSLEYQNYQFHALLSFVCIKTALVFTLPFLFFVLFAYLYTGVEAEQLKTKKSGTFENYNMLIRCTI